MYKPLNRMLDTWHDWMRAPGEPSAKKKHRAAQRQELINRALAAAPPSDRALARSFPAQYLKVGGTQLRRDLAQVQTREQERVQAVKHEAARLRQSIAETDAMLTASAAAPLTEAERQAILDEDARLARELGLHDSPELPVQPTRQPVVRQTTAKPAASFVRRERDGRIRGSGAAGTALLAQLDRLRRAHDGGLTLSRLGRAWRETISKALT